MRTITTEMVWITTGLGLAVLWVWCAQEGQLPDTEASVLEKEDSGEPAQEDNYTRSSTTRILPNHTRLRTPLLKARTQSIELPGLGRTAGMLSSAAFYKKLQQKYEVTQLTITNHSCVEREVRLWAGNKKPPLSPALPGDIADHIFQTINVSSNVGTGVYPQGIVVNPFNGFIYIANQLSNNISVLDKKGTLIRFIDVAAHNQGSPSHPAYGWGPVALAVNSQTDSPNFGKVYVANCIADMVAVISTELTITHTFPVGLRPVAIQFNSFTGKLYTANIAEDTVTVIDTATENVITTVAVGKSPRSIAVQPETGAVFVVNSGDDTLTILNSEDQTVQTLDNIGSGLTTAVYHPLTQKVYVVAGEDNTVVPVALETVSLQAPIVVGNRPYAIVYHPNSQLLYVGNREDNTFTIIDQNDNVVNTLALGTVNIGLAVDPASDRLFSTDPNGGSIGLISYSDESSAVTINEEYEAKREDFKFKPALVEHVKFVLSGTARFRVLKLEKETVTGTTAVQPISFSGYHSPQNYGNVAEVFEMKGTIIDGKHGWVFKIGGRQTITLLTYYTQPQTDLFNQILENQ